MVSQNNYVIGVDGGGTKTTAALADLKGRVLKIDKAGSSSPRNVGIEKAVESICEAMKKVLPKSQNKIVSVFIGLPAVQERPELLPKIKKELFKDKRIAGLLRGKSKIGSDQIVAFRSGTDKKDGVVLIAGTGAVAHGWRSQREHEASGWGWLADEGSAFWIGQKVFQAIRKNLDGRGPKTLLTGMISKELLAKRGVEQVASFSLLCELAAKKGDKIAKNILTQAGSELALAVSTVIRKLNFSKEKFPLVLVGGVLKSKIVLKTVQKEIRKIAPRAQFIMPPKKAVIGAVKLAIEYASSS